MNYYKHGNGRIQLRSTDGQFRPAVPGDGYVQICKCGGMTPLRPRQRDANGFPIPGVLTPTYCRRCGLNFETGITFQQEFNALIGEG